MTDLIIVGAGPAGLAAALHAKALGHHPLVLEAGSAGRDRRGSRAIFIHQRTLDLLDAAHPGLGPRIASDGLVWPVKQTFWAGRKVFERAYTADQVRRAPFASLPQPAIEQHLMDACRTTGVDIRWDTPVTAVRTTGDTVTLHTADSTVLHSPYLIAADGARSTIRTSLGIRLSGGTSRKAFVIADVAEDPGLPLPPARLFHYRHPAADRRNVLLVPFQGGWRLDIQCRPDDDPAHLTDRAPQFAHALLGPAYRDRVTWASSYHFRQRVAEHFTDPHQRVLLAGEAAHQFPPFGARGMNSGIADAHAAATAIHTALTAPAPRTAHDAVRHYADRRRTAALHNSSAAATALAHLEADRLTTRARQHAAALLAPHWPRAGQWLDSAPYGPRLNHAPANGY
ncbi:FAD-dependent monooxygenase [Streptomyces olivoreticuli]